MSTIHGAPFGEIPWHVSYGETLDEPWFAYGHTMAELHAQGVPWSSIRWLPPGHDLHMLQDRQILQQTYQVTVEPNDHDREEAAQIIRKLLDASCAARSSPATAGVLLSGGVDSAAVAVGLLAAGQPLRAYTAVHDPKSGDLKGARMVAKHLGLELVEVHVPVPSMGDLLHTIRTIEMPYKAQVEIGWPCIQLAQAMQADGITVAYGGEGSDELWASHAFAYQERKRAGAGDFHQYRANDFAKQATRNFPREWKAYAAHGIEVRLPFIDPDLVEYILALREPVCRDSTWHAKRPLQAAYAQDLPEWITTRQKVGFQDGLGIKPRISAALGIEQPKLGAYYRTLHQSIFPGARS